MRTVLPLVSSTAHQFAWGDGYLASPPELTLLRTRRLCETPVALNGLSGEPWRTRPHVRTVLPPISATAHQFAWGDGYLASPPELTLYEHGGFTRHPSP